MEEPAFVRIEDVLDARTKSDEAEKPKGIPIDDVMEVVYEMLGRANKGG